MKKLALAVSLLFIISCHKKVDPETARMDSLYHLPIDHSDNTDMEVVSAVDHKSDSIYYKIDVRDNLDDETFLVVKKTYVGDSCFGKYNQGNNTQRAYLYGKRQFGNDFRPTVKYHIRWKVGKKFEEIWQVVDTYDAYNYVDLDAGNYWRKNVATEKYKITKFIKIYWRDYDSVDFECMNFKYENGEWTLISKEKLNTRPEKYQTIGYCMDSINKEYNSDSGDKKLPKSEISFNRAFYDLYNTWWRCNDDLKLVK